jgi:HSP20 family protein
MTLVKFNRKPLESSFNSFVDDFFSEMPTIFGNGLTSSVIPVNIKETANGYDLEVVAPGFEKADFQVNVDQDVLTVSAEKKEEAKNEEGGEKNKMIRSEYSYKSFKRSFTLDDKIDAAGIEAKYVNGVLTLNLPRKAEVKSASKQISIQ